MLRLHWNELKVGDHVLVHDVDQPHLRLVPGVVSCVDTATGSNDIAIRLVATGAARTVRPQRLAVHLDPVGLGEQCWRCDRPPRSNKP
jgi:hypothetical protein